MGPANLILKNQFGEESTNTVLGSVVPLVPDSNVVFISSASTPVNGGSGTGVNVANTGSICVALDTGALYYNSNTKASPTWTSLGAGTTATLLTGFVAGAGTVSAADSVLQGFDKIVGNQSALQNGTPTFQTETVAAAGALSTTKAFSLVNNGTGGSYAVTLAAPSSQDGQLKVIKLGTATHTVTLAMTAIKGPGFCTLSGTTTLTFTSTGDCAILMAVGALWMLIGGTAVAS